MKSNIQSRKATYNESHTASNGQTYNTSVLQDYYSRSFTVSGFGKGDPKRQVPTPGSYTIDERSSLLGSRSVSQYSLITNNWVSTTHSSGVHNSVYDGLNGFDSFDYETASVRSACLTKFNDSVRQSSVNLALTIGEAGETVRMIKSIGGMIFRLRRLRRDLLHNPSLLLAGGWLSAKYGILPAISDVYGYAQFTRAKLLTFDVRARVYRRLSPLKSYNYLGYNYSYSGRRFHKYEIGARSRISDASSFDIYRLTSINPFAIAWELLPLSFVADWFIDIGGWLNNLEATFNHGLIFDHGYETSTRGCASVCNVSYSFNGPNANGYRETNNFSASSSRTWIKKDRVLLTSYPRPDIPTLDVRLGWQRITSAAALIRTIVLGKRF